MAKLGILFELVLLVAVTAFGQTPVIPDCPLRVTDGAATIYLVAIYAHESPTYPGMRYTFETDSMIIAPGEVATPCPCEGYPIGFEWYYIPPNFTKSAGVVVKECGDTGRPYPRIFKDGFESGDTSRWDYTYIPPPALIFDDGFEFGSTEMWSETIGGS
jgi:hypothetical protein